MVCGVLSGACTAALLALINRALGQAELGGLRGLAGPFAGLLGAVLVTRMGSQMMLNRLQQGVLLTLRLRLSKHLMSASLRQLEQAGAHRLLNSLLQDLFSISIGVIQLPEVFTNLAILVGVFGYMAWLSLPLFGAMMVFFVLGMVVFTLPSRRGFQLQHASRARSDELTQRFVALVNGAKELRLNRERRADFYVHEVTRTAVELRREWVRSDDWLAVANSLSGVLFTGVIGLLLFVLPQLTPVTLPQLLSAVLAVLYVQQPLAVITVSVPSLGRATVALQHIDKLGVELGTEGPDLPPGPVPRREVKRVELVGATHTYRRENEEETFTLGPLHFALERGEVVFLIGGNGSGKTTMAKLLSGLYAPERGECRVDGVPVPADQRDDYRQLFSVVFFDFFLFERLLGASSPALLEQARGYLKELHLDRKVQIQDGALTTLALSQGQRKRLALLMAYLEDRPVYVFDEWAADQDPTFKEIFYRQLLPDLKRRGKAVLVISHDDRYFGLADRVVRLELGQLVAPPSTEPAPLRVLPAVSG